MLRLLAFETRLLLRQRSTWLTLAVLLIACVVAASNGRALLVQQQEGRVAFAATAATAAAKTAEALAEAKDVEDTVMTPVRTTLPIIAPLPRLVDFSAGRAWIEPFTATTGLRTRSDTLFRNEALDNPELAARGTIDLGFVVIVVAPLLLIALGFGIFARDRDSGAASLILAQAGSPLPLIVARSLPTLAVVAVPIVITAVLLLVTGPAIDGRRAAAAAWLAMAGLSLLFWWSLVLIVNSLRVGAETAGLALAALWAVLVLIAPALILAAAQAASPAPSRFDQIATARASEIASTAAYENDHPELVDESLAAQRASARKGASISTSIDAAVAPLSAAFDASLDVQQTIVRRAQIVSLPLVASDALTAIAGTDAAAYRVFRDASARYRLALKAQLNRLTLRETVLTNGDLENLPRFEAPAASRVLIWPFAMLAVATLGISGLAATRYRRTKLA